MIDSLGHVFDPRDSFILLPVILIPYVCHIILSLLQSIESSCLNRRPGPITIFHLRGFLVAYKHSLGISLADTVSSPVDVHDGSWAKRSLITVGHVHRPWSVLKKSYCAWIHPLNGSIPTWNKRLIPLFETTTVSPRYCYFLLWLSILILLAGVSCGATCCSWNSNDIMRLHKLGSLTFFETWPNLYYMYT